MDKEGDQLHPGDSRQGVLELQGMLPIVPHIGIAGGVRFNGSLRISREVNAKPCAYGFCEQMGI